MYNKLYMHTEFTEDTEVLDSRLKISLCSPCSLCEIIEPEKSVLIVFRDFIINRRLTRMDADL
jgi:hypothetical protein